ncbi:MAG: hypothetical protein ACREIT_10660 [Tepidisphaeraceae bacterium]
MPLVDNLVLDKKNSHKRYFVGLSEQQKEVLLRAQLLEREDRLLVDLAVRGRRSHYQIARLIGIDRGNVTRRLRRLSIRLHDPLVVALIDQDCPLRAELRLLALEHYLGGKTIRHLADRHEMTLNEVKRALEYVRGWHRGVRDGGM